MSRIRSVLSVIFLLSFSAPAFAQFVSADDGASLFSVLRWWVTVSLSNPNVFYLILLVGFFALLHEFTHGGFGVSGIMGIVCLSLGVASFRMLPVNWVALLVIVFAIGLFLWEAFVPANGIILAAGVVLMAVGSLYLFQPVNPPMRVAYSVVLILTMLTAFLTVFLVRSAIRAQGSKIMSGKEGMIGLKGDAWSDLVPGKAGKVSAQGTLWNALSEETISKGEPVEIVAVDGMVLKVKRVLPEKKGG
ncbi:MAG: hypothetical protein HGA80_00345 [Candidatus Omnitrophica bacterium]|nr:hypothetical protein [Candidatus Omnitrophota bacterium]